MEHFSEEEKRLLQPFVSNFDRHVFVLRNLPEVVKGALFSRYSRSAKSLRRTLLEEFIKKEESGFNGVVGSYDWKDSAGQMVATQKAEAFYDRVLVGYGDDSVAELAGAHIALEDISIIATKIVEDARIGLSPLEKSTRYVYFDQKADGRYRYYMEPALMKSEFANEYEKTCDMLFETYAKLIPRISEYVRGKMPKEESLSERAYEAIVRTKTCDILRGLLPASTLTNMGFFGNGRAYEYLITKMYADQLGEIMALAKEMQEELRTTIPAFVKRPDTEQGKEMQRYLAGVRSSVEKEAGRLPELPERGQGCEEVTLVEYDKEAGEKVLTSALYPYSKLPMENVKEAVAAMEQQRKRELLLAYAGERKSRRHRPGRAFEEAYYTFEICTNFGAYRDIHRHRIVTQQRQLLGCGLGYTLPPEIMKAGYEKEFRDAMEQAKETWKLIVAAYPKEAQYVVPLAYRIRWELKMNLREAYHFCELRAAMQGHVDYRVIAQKMFEEIGKVHPMLAEAMVFVDRNSYELGRLEAEKRLDRKIEEMERKHSESGKNLTSPLGHSLR